MTFDWSHYFLESTSPDLVTFPDTAINFTALPTRAKGFDTSYWNHGNAGAQKPIDFAQAYAAGYSFWIGRLTRGQNYIDTWIERDYEAASRTPLIKCVYHVLYPGEPVGPHVENLKRGLALLPEPPKAIGLDLERGAEFGVTAVTKCLVDTVAAIREWWTGKLLLYANLNYLRNYIWETRGLDIWLSWPAEGGAYNPIDNPPIDCVIYQRSYRQAIYDSAPDTTIDLDEFMGDETAMRAYFNALEPTEPPEEEMPDITKVKTARDLLNQYIAEAEGQPTPAPVPTPTPPPPAPVNVRKFYVDPEGDKAKANARFIYKWNDAGRPVFQIYPSDNSLASDRQQFNAGEVVQIEGDIWTGDGGLKCYQLYDPQGEYKARPLFIRKDDGYLV